MSSCHTFRPVPGQFGPRGRGPLPAPPFAPQDYWATKKFVSSLFESIETKIDKFDVVDPSAEAEAGKAADAKSTYEELNRILGVASDAQKLAESKADQSELEAHVKNALNPHGVTAEQIFVYTKSEVNTRLDEKADKATTVAGYGITDAATKTEIAAKADLVGGKIPAAQLPSYVDDVLEYDTMSAFPTDGESGKIYVAKDTNLVYRWSGTQYVEISPSPAFDNTVTETSQNGVKSSGIWSWVKSLLPQWLTSAYAEPATVASVAAKADKSELEAHVKNALNPHGVTAEQIFVYTKSEVNTKLDEKADKSALEAHVKNTNNPHAVTAEQVGAYTKSEVETKLDEKADRSVTVSHFYDTTNPHHVTAEQVGAYTREEVDTKVDGKLDKQCGIASIDWNDEYSTTYLQIKNTILDFYTDIIGGLTGVQIGGNTLYGDEWQLTSTLRVFQKIQFLPGAQLTFIDASGKEERIEDCIKRLSSIAPEYSATSAYTVGQYVFHDGSIYRCTTAIALPGEAWNPAHWSGAQKLDDFFTDSNSLLTGTIDARLPSPLYAVPSAGLLKDRAINTTSLASVTVPNNFTDLLIRASVSSSLSVTMPAETTKYGDTFPGEAGEYLITITKTGAAEAYVRTIKLEEVANA